jgi:TctA family transporter
MFLSKILLEKEVIKIFDLILACIIGVLCGAITGLIPGIHVNTAWAFIFASSTFLLAPYSPEVLYLPDFIGHFPCSS